MGDEFEFERGEILTNLTLLEDHAAKNPCPYCMEKHSSKIIGYAEEIALGENDKEMEKLAEQARNWRRIVQGAKEHKHTHNPGNPGRLYEPSGLTTLEKSDKAKVHGHCTPKSTSRYCRLVRCIKKVEAQGTAESPVAVCRATIYGGAK